MIVSFSVENWMSFRDKATLSMVASKERQHGERVPKLDKYKTRVLPIAAIYGGNASGKSNFIAALSFSQQFVTRGAPIDSLIGVEPFRLNATSAKSPSRFSFELLIDESIYEFSFAVTREAVVEEKLVLVTVSSERVLYDRQGEQLNLDASLAKNKRLQFVFQGTRQNQLFLANSVSQRVDDFQPVYDWFRNRLRIAWPDAPYEYCYWHLGESCSREAMSNALSQLDTGITGLAVEEVDIEKLSLPEKYIASLKSDVDKERSIRLRNPSGRGAIYVSREKGDLVARMLIARRSTAQGGEVEFKMHEESDGIRRMIDLLPAFLDLSSPSTDAVYVIDEIDRSLHTLLIHELLTAYLSNCSTETRSQLLLTTHDALLMDQQLFRRDEIWVTERDNEGATTLFSFSEYKDIRYDKDIRKSYLEGRLGGVPRILLGINLNDFNPAEEG